VRISEEGRINREKENESNLGKKQMGPIISQRERISNVSENESIMKEEGLEKPIRP